MKPYQRILRDGTVNLRGQAVTFTHHGQPHYGHVVTRTRGTWWLIACPTLTYCVLDRADFEVVPQHLGLEPRATGA